MSIQYLNEVRILPSLNIRNKFNENKTKVIKQNNFSIIHYNKFKTRTFETFTQTFPIYSNCSISKNISFEYKNYKKIFNTQTNVNNKLNLNNNNNPMRLSQNKKSSKIFIDAGKTQKQNNNLYISNKNTNQNNKTGKYKLKQINK